MSVVEICLASNDIERLKLNVSIVNQSEVARIELCQDMDVGGLTPTITAVKCARRCFERKGLMVMIRPRSGDFCYIEKELDLMQSQILQVANAGADGVVFGALNPKGKSLNEKALSKLVQFSKSLNLEVTVHRSIDCVDDRRLALRTLTLLGVDRVLTIGGRWGDSLTALDTIEPLQQVLAWADQEIEIVIGGGVSPNNVDSIVYKANEKSRYFSLHAYSSVLKNGVVQKEKIKALIGA